MANHRVVIIGAGLAGLTAALRLVRQGCAVTVLEQRQVLGGRTSSWTEGDMQVESGLHKVLGIYRAMPQLLRDVGVALDDIVVWVDAVEIHSSQRRQTGYFVVAPLHRPVATLRTALTSRYVTWAERIKLARFLAGGLYRLARDPAYLDATNVAAYARQYGLREESIQRLLDPLTQVWGTLANALRVAAPVAAGLRHGGTMRVGAFRGGMTDVLIRPIVDAIERSGGEIIAGVTVTGLIVRGRTVLGVVAGQQQYQTDHVIIATPVAVAQQLVGKHFADEEWARRFLRLNTVSTISVQLELDSPVFPTDHTHLSATMLACFAEQAHSTFPGSSGRLSAILYPADALLHFSDEALVARTVDAASSLGIPLPSIRRTAVVRHPHEFYAIEPDAESLRPTGKTPIRGLSLAGDYVRQPFLASMEGAIISGNRAATLATS